jgi:hypothetical protein
LGCRNIYAVRTATIFDILSVFIPASNFSLERTFFLAMPTKFVPFPRNPTRLSSRYEVRQLTAEHFAWAAAIVCHSNMFHSPVWPIAYPEDKVKRLYAVWQRSDYLVNHQIDSGMSFGIFDLEYKYKRPESAATGGKLYWDEKELYTDGPTLLEQMDFPLCSVALAYDGINELDLPKMMPLIEAMPLFATIFHELEVIDKRDPASWKPKGPKEVLMRNATSTRADYEGKGLMKKLALWLMKQATENGFRGVQIECAHDAVTHVWLNPPKPFSAELLGKFDTAAYTQENEEGKTINPFRGGKQVITKIYVTLVSLVRPQSHLTTSESSANVGFSSGPRYPAENRQ